MEGSGTKLNLVLLDACRNNPFGGRGLRGAEGGLAQMRAPEGTLISYATQPGNVAFDGDAGHSPYTNALARTIRKAGLDLFQTFNEVGLSVMQVTGNSQQPWVSASPIRGTFHFVISGEITIAPSAAARMSEAAEAWAATQNSTSIGVLQAFADRYSSTAYGRMAHARIEELKRVTTAPILGSSRLQTAEVAPPVRPNLPCTSHSPADVSFSSRAARAAIGG
jgi:hypothetical protein